MNPPASRAGRSEIVTGGRWFSLWVACENLPSEEMPATGSAGVAGRARLNRVGRRFGARRKATTGTRRRSYPSGGESSRRAEATGQERASIDSFSWCVLRRGGSSPCGSPKVQSSPPSPPTSPPVVGAPRVCRQRLRRGSSISSPSRRARRSSSSCRTSRMPSPGSRASAWSRARGAAATSRPPRCRPIRRPKPR